MSAQTFRKLRARQARLIKRIALLRAIGDERSPSQNGQYWQLRGELSTCIEILRPWNRLLSARSARMEGWNR